jgi:hypothetical protein
MASMTRKNHRRRQQRQQGGKPPSSYPTLAPTFMELQRNAHEQAKNKLTKNLINTATRKASVAKALLKPATTEMEIQTNSQKRSFGTQTNRTTRSILSRSTISLFEGTYADLKKVPPFVHQPNYTPLIEIAYRDSKGNGSNLIFTTKDLFEHLSSPDVLQMMYRDPNYKIEMGLAI